MVPLTTRSAHASRVPLQLEPIVRATATGLLLERVEVMAGGAIAAAYAADDALLELDVLVAEAASGLQLPAAVAVHLNLPRLDGHVIHHSRYMRALERIARERVLVLEIHETTWDAGFREADSIARRTGAVLAVDDLAPGNLGWQWALDAVADALATSHDTGSFRAATAMAGKVDVAWFQTAMSDVGRWDGFRRALRRFAVVMDVIIVEGVETRRHLELLRGLADEGLPLGFQGYLINTLCAGDLVGHAPSITCRQRARG